MRVRSYYRAVCRSVYSVLYDEGCEHAGRAEENGVWLREFHAPSVALGCLAGACLNGEMGWKLDAKMVLYQ